METFSALLAICAGNSPASGEFPDQRPVTRSFDVFFDLHLNEQLSKHWRGWWFETPSWSLWRHRNDYSQWNHSYVMQIPLQMCNSSLKHPHGCAACCFDVIMIPLVCRFILRIYYIYPYFSELPHKALWQANCQGTYQLFEKVHSTETAAADNSTESRINIKMASRPYRKSHCWDKTVLRSS